MRYYAIKNKNTGAYIGGADFNYQPPRQIEASEYRPPKLFAENELYIEWVRRKISATQYEAVEVSIVEVEE